MSKETLEYVVAKAKELLVALNKYVEQNPGV